MVALTTPDDDTLRMTSQMDEVAKELVRLGHVDLAANLQAIRSKILTQQPGELVMALIGMMQFTHDLERAGITVPLRFLLDRRAN